MNVICKVIGLPRIKRDCGRTDLYQEVRRCVSDERPRHPGLGLALDCEPLSQRPGSRLTRANLIRQTNRKIPDQT